MEDRPRYLSIPAISRLGLLKESTLRQMDRQHQLPSIRIRSRTYVNYDQLIDMLRTRQVVSGGEKNE